MKKIAVVVDTNSGITKEEADKLGIYLIPMPFIIGDDVLYEGVDLSQEEFYRLQSEDVKITTSQPNINSIVELWEDLLKKYDQVIHVPMSSALSQSCETAENFAQNYPNKVFVVDNKRISITSCLCFFGTCLSIINIYLFKWGFTY